MLASTRNPETANARPPTTQNKNKQKHNPLRILHWNCNGLARKINLLINYTLSHSIDIICLNELRTHSENANFLLNQFTEFNCIHKCRKPISANRGTVGGGVAIMMRKGLEYSRLSIGHSVDTEIIGVSIRTKDSPVHIYSYYNKPQTDLNIPLLTKALEANVQVVILGDLSAKHISLGCKQSNKNGAHLASMLVTSNAILANQHLGDTYIPTSESRSSDKLDWLITTRPQQTNLARYQLRTTASSIATKCQSAANFQREL